MIKHNNMKLLKPHLNVVQATLPKPEFLDLNLEDKKLGMGIGNKWQGLGREDGRHGTKVGDRDGQDWSWDGNVRSGFNNSLIIYIIIF